MSGIKQCGLFAGASALVLFLGLASSAEPVVGHVVSIAGAPRAETPAGDSRTLGCGDAVHAGERVVAGADGRVGLLADALFAQIEHDSRVVADFTEAGVPAFGLENGRLRVVDTREPGQPPHRISTPHAEARGVGTDSEAYTLDEKAGAYSIVCEWGDPLDVARGDEHRETPPGACTVAKPSEPLYAAEAHDERIPLAGADACDPGAILGPVAGRLSPTDVAAGPPAVGSLLLPPAPPGFNRDPSDLVAGATAALTPPVESPAPPGTLPGLGGGGL